MKKYIFPLIAMAIVLVLSWSSGTNLDERGLNLFLTLYFMFAAGGLTYFLILLDYE